jgi:hypothetical protein
MIWNYQPTIRRPGVTKDNVAPSLPINSVAKLDEYLDQVAAGKNR